MRKTSLEPELFDVVVVPARNAYAVYLEHSVYWCPHGRSFRRDHVRRLGFYSEGMVREHFPLIVEWCDDVRVAEVVSSRAKNQNRLRGVVMGLVQQGEIERKARIQLVYLTGPDDRRTLRLDKPIVNDMLDKNGHPTAWAQRQRYVRSEALLKAPRTTNKLDAESGRPEDWRVWKARQPV